MCVRNFPQLDIYQDRHCFGGFIYQPIDGHFVETQSVEQEINLIVVKVDYVMDLYYP